MKIAVVLNTSWNIYNFRMNLIREFLEAGYEVHTIAPEDEYTWRLRDAGCIHHAVKMDSRGANPIKDSALVLELLLIYRKIRPDVIFHYTIKPNVYGTLAASLLRVPVVNNVCGLGTAFLKKNLTSYIALFLYRISFRFARKVFFQNPDDLKLFMDKKLVPVASVDLLPGSGIDLEKFQPSVFRKNERFTFLLISRLITDKGILEFIDAVKILRAKGLNADFKILGARDPEHKRGIQNHVIDAWIANNTIDYLGTTDDVRKFIHAADCVVLPSYREGTPRALLEAASLGKPIVATDVPGCNHVVTHNYNGLLCRAKDAEDLAQKMLEMAGYDEGKLRQLGANGRRKMVEHFDERLVIGKYMETSQTLVRVA